MGLDHIMLIEFEEQCGPFCTKKVLLYNANRITEAEALRLARADEYNENILIIPKRQWSALFEAEKSNAVAETENCPFCENLRKTKETHDWYRDNSPRHAGTRVEYKAALVTEQYEDRVDWCTGTTAYQQMPLNFCPVCGVKIDFATDNKQNK